jgi:hypothetical protein
VEKAWELDNRINERAGTQVLVDDEFDDAISISTDSGLESPYTLAARVIHAKDKDKDKDKVPPKRINRVSRGLDVLDKISQSLDPNSQADRDNRRADYSMQAMQLLLNAQQLRDAQVANDALRTQLADLSSRVQLAENARQQAEHKLEVMELTRKLIPPKYIAPRPPMSISRRKKTKHQVQVDDDNNKYYEVITKMEFDSSDKENHPPKVRKVSIHHCHPSTPKPSTTPDTTSSNTTPTSVNYEAMNVDHADKE